MEKLREDLEVGEVSEPEEFAGEFFTNIVDKSKRKRRKKNLSKQKLQNIKKAKLTKWKMKLKNTIVG